MGLVVIGFLLGIACTLVLALGLAGDDKEY